MSYIHTYIIMYIHTYIMYNTYILYTFTSCILLYTLFYRFLEACSLANLMQLNSTDVCMISVYIVCVKKVAMRNVDLK